MAKKEQIELGDLVRDVITGREGPVVQMETSLWRCRRPSVYYEKMDGNGHDRIVTYDEGQLEIRKKKHLKPKKDTSDQPVIQLGDLVECLITGFQGVATAREEFLYRCDRLSVQPVSKEKNKMDDAFTMDCQSLKVIKDGYVRTHETSEPQKTAGAPMQRVKRS